MGVIARPVNVAPAGRFHPRRRSASDSEAWGKREKRARSGARAPRPPLSAPSPPLGEGDEADCGRASADNRRAAGASPPPPPRSAYARVRAAPSTTAVARRARRGRARRGARVSPPLDTPAPLLSLPPRPPPLPPLGGEEKNKGGRGERRKFHARPRPQKRPGGSGGAGTLAVDHHPHATLGDGRESDLALGARAPTKHNRPPADAGAATPSSRRLAGRASQPPRLPLLFYPLPRSLDAQPLLPPPSPPPSALPSKNPIDRTAASRRASRSTAPSRGL
jgi:hypothetical protein